LRIADAISGGKNDGVEQGIGRTGAFHEEAIATAAAKSENWVVADLHRYVPADSKRLGKSLVDIVAEDAFRHEDLLETRYGCRHGGAKFSIGAKPIIEIIGIARGHRKVSNATIENFAGMARGERLPAADAGIRVEELQMKRRPHGLHQCDRRHHAGKAASDDGDTWHGGRLSRSR